MVPVVCRLKVKALAEMAIEGGAWPVPRSETLCGDATALLVMVRFALRDPVLEGVKFKLTLQLAPPVKIEGQVLAVIA